MDRRQPDAIRHADSRCRREGQRITVYLRHGSDRYGRADTWFVRSDAEGRPSINSTVVYVAESCHARNHQSDNPIEG